MRVTRVPSAFVVAAALLATRSALADVTPRNGNFTFSRTDIAYDGGMGMKVERIYNSKSGTKGIFGWGWGTEYEIYLSVSGDRSVTVHEYGGSTGTAYLPADFSERDVTSEIDALLAMGGDHASYREKLRLDEAFRHQEWARLGARMAPPRIAPGTHLASRRLSHHQLWRVQGGYLRVADGGRTERFDEAGKLTRIYDAGPNFIEISYDARGQIEKIADNLGRHVVFGFTPQGLVDHLSGDRGKHVSFRYDPAGDLVASEDADGKSHEHRYDRGEHNMIRIAHPDKTITEIAYYSPAQHGNVRWLKEPDGTQELYSYREDPGDTSQLLVSVERVDPRGRPLGESLYEYHFGLDRSGESWTQRLREVQDDRETVTTYDERCHCPLSIKRGNAEARFAYDERGRVTWKETPTEVVALTYHPRLGKLTRAVQLDRTRVQGATQWIDLAYDARGNLTGGESSTGKRVRLTYDGYDRLATLDDGEGTRLSFTYDEDSRWAAITVHDVGAMAIRYKPDGAIDTNHSDLDEARVWGAAKKALRRLLELLRPGTVRLTF